MKNLNKIILTSAIGLGSFGFLGDKNVSAQNIFDKFKRQIINEYAGRSGELIFMESSKIIYLFQPIILLMKKERFIIVKTNIK